ncbi:hypothetical protein L7F22_000771 [Adiantum nelumboides]|nr:hypothetical protein [Adiantum nelumboides]
MNMAQLMENAEVANDLMQGNPDEDRFKTRRKEPEGKQFSAKGNVTTRFTVPPFKKKPFIGNKLPPERLEDHRIHLVLGSSPLNRPPYRVSATQHKGVMSQINELLEKGKDGSWRMCIDYHALYKNTIKNRFPILRIDGILDRLQGASLFSRMDLKSGYHQICNMPEDVHKTVFKTTFGLYEFLVMPFSLTNAPGTFNRMMTKFLDPIEIMWDIVR